jgi:zinc transport system ATP-binding protein
MKIFECKKLSIGYGNKVVCKNINFEVRKGQYICVIGENGSGKSTLLKTILGLNKTVSGKIVFDKEFPSNSIGYLPQQSDMQKDFPATVKEVIMSGFVGAMGFRPFYKREEKAKAEKIMEELEIKDLAKKSYKELSGGQQQRVLLARALCATNELLVMDEPVTGLDSKAIRKFYALIKKLNKENGLTIIMVSHNIDKVIDYASDIIYLSTEKAFVGTKEEFLTSDYAKQYKLGDN